MQNKLVDLNNHLFAQMERLCEEETKGDDLVEEITRARAVADIAKAIIGNGRLAFDAMKERKGLTGELKNLPPMLDGGIGKSNGNGNGKKIRKKK